MHRQPPRLALKLFRWYCSDHRLEELEGDLLEQFEIDVELGRPAPRLRFWWNVIRCARAYSRKQIKRKEQKIRIVMTKRSLILFLRNFRKNPLFGTLNLLGLSLAIASFGIVAIYINYETNFENFHQNADQIYRVTYHTSSANGSSHWARVPVDYVNQLPEEVSGIQRLIRFQNHEQKFIKVGTRKFIEDHVYQTDGEVFDVFTFRFLEGDPATALKNPKSAVLTKSLAKKFFGEEAGLGKEISIAGEWNPSAVRYKVTGIVDDLPENTHLPINMLISFDSPEQRTWWSYTYILVNRAAVLNELQASIDAFVKEHSTNETLEESFVIQPIKSIHLNSSLAREIIPNGDWQNVKTFAVIGAMILFIGLVNFSNLNSVASISRMKEVGIRKALGAFDSHIFKSVLMDSLLYAIFSLAIGGLLIFLLYPAFQQFTGAVMVMDLPVFIGLLVGTAVLIGLIAGLYPASFSTRYKALQLLGTKLPSFKALGSSSYSLKKIMLAMQFSIATLLICCALIASDQFAFMTAQSLKMEPEQVLAIPRIPNHVKEQYPTLREQLSSIPGVQAVTACMEVPSREIRDAGAFIVSDLHGTHEEAPTFDIQIVDHEFFDLMNLHLIAGKNFPDYIKPAAFPQLSEDYTFQDYLTEKQRAYLINESASKVLGWQDPEEAISKMASFDQVVRLKDGPIVGVVEDYHQSTLKNRIKPTIYIYEPLWLNTVLLRVDSGNMLETVSAIEATWDNLFSNFKIEYHFLDDLYDQLYSRERKQLELLYVFSSMAIFIAFLGIVGLVAYVLKTKMKELAIRKVLGANLLIFIQLIGREYVMLLMISLVVSVPACLYAMDLWLSDFAYHVDIDPVAFVTSAFLVLLLLLTTIGLQTLRASSSNPIHHLRE